MSNVLHFKPFDCHMHVCGFVAMPLISRKTIFECIKGASANNSIYFMHTAQCTHTVHSKLMYDNDGNSNTFDAYRKAQINDVNVAVYRARTHTHPSTQCVNYTLGSMAVHLWMAEGTCSQANTHSTFKYLLPNGMNAHWIMFKYKHKLYNFRNLHKLHMPKRNCSSNWIQFDFSIIFFVAPAQLFIYTTFD